MAHRRMVGFGIVVALLFSAVVVRLADVQLLHPQRYVATGESQRLVSNVIPAGRGSILDRNGVELALSLPQKTVFADPKLVRESHHEGAYADQLASILHLDRDDVYRRIMGKGRFQVLAHTVSDPVAAHITNLHMQGIAMFDEFKRFQPSGDVGRALLGGVSTDGATGTSGLEEQFNSLLEGKAGSVTYEREGDASGSTKTVHDRGTTIAGGLQRITPARPGSDLQLTIDAPMQYETEQVLADYVASAGAKGGIAIITRPGTGEILAMANVAVDPGGQVGVRADVHSTSNNLALTTVFEPGSVTKVITLASAMDAGLITPTTPMVVPDQLQVADHLFHDDSPHPTEQWTPTDVLVTSSNIGAIKIAQMLGRDRLDAAMRRFGLGSLSGLGFPNESAGLMLPTNRWSGTSIGSIPIGQGIAVTALQMLDAFNVVANDGVFVGPRLVNATVGTDGHRTVEPPSTRRRVISAQTASSIREMMTKVVSEKQGTGGKAAIPGYSVAGKTGTARKPVDPHMPGNGYMDLSGHYHYVATFAGFVPAQKPELSIIVVIDDPTSSIFAADVAAPAFSELARYALRRYDIPPPVGPVSGPTVPDVSASAQGLGDNMVPGSVSSGTTTSTTPDTSTTDGDHRSGTTTTTSP
jgi:cell division protein FtsI (penicillin-binding protein 3)